MRGEAKNIMQIEGIFVILIILAIIAIPITKKVSAKKRQQQLEMLAEENKARCIQLSEKFKTEGLPVVTSANILMDTDEVCHFQGHAEYGEIKNRVVGYTGSSNGRSVRLFKGFSVRSGQSTKTAIRDDIIVKTEGTIYLTSRRIIFAAARKSQNIKLKSILALDTAKGMLVIQTGSGQHSFYIDDHPQFLAILGYLINTNTNDNV